jgi:hypothetical protein
MKPELEEGKMEFLLTFILGVMDLDGFICYILPTIEETFKKNPNNSTIQKIKGIYKSKFNK